MKIYKIYLVTNLINNKKYVGQTSMDIEKRWNYHIRNDSGCTYISRSIQKYGHENFNIEWIASSFCIEQLNELEQYFIKKYNTLSPNGYNLTTGGFQCEFSEETKNIMSDKLKQRYENMSKEEREYFTRGITSYIQNKRKKITGINDSHDIIHFDSILDAEKSGYYAENSLRDSYSKANGYMFFYDEKYTIEEMKELLKKANTERRIKKDKSCSITANKIKELSKSRTDNKVVAVNPETLDIKYFINQQDASKNGFTSSSVNQSLHFNPEKPARSKGYHFFYQIQYTIEQMFEISKQRNEIIQQRFLEGREKFKNNKKVLEKNNSEKLPLIGINPKTYQYIIFESKSMARKLGYSDAAIYKGIRGEKRTSKDLHFQYFTKSIQEHIQYVKILFS